MISLGVMLWKICTKIHSIFKEVGDNRLLLTICAHPPNYMTTHYRGQQASNNKSFIAAPINGKDTVGIFPALLSVFNIRLMKQCT
jgi:hypothetical protein